MSRTTNVTFRELQAIRTSPHDAPRIVLARPDHFGDVLLTLPAAAALREALPGAHITFLVPEQAAGIPRHCPDVDETCVAPFPPLSSWPGPPDWAEVARREAPRLSGRFDIAILPRPEDPLSGLLLALAGVPLRIGYAVSRTRPFLTRALPVPPGKRHVVMLALDLAAEAASCLGVRLEPDAPHPSELHFVSSATEESELEAALAPVVAACGVDPIVLHPGAGWPLKQWPVWRWGELAARLKTTYGVSPLVVRGPREDELESAIIEASGGQAAGLSRHLSPGALAALHRRARLVISIDSGPLHLAAMLGAPVIGLYGPANPVEFRPWCLPQQYREVRVPLPCSPCGTLVDPPCGATALPECMVGITIEAVVTAARGLLST
jgi:heptosyltransferase III